MKRLKTNGRRWAVLNYIVSEPGEWTCRKIANDREDSFHSVTEAAIFLTQNGFVEKGEKEGRSHTLIPTKAGIDLLYNSL